MTEQSFVSRVKGYGFIGDSDLRQNAQIPPSDVYPTMPMNDFGRTDGLLAKQVGQDALLGQTMFYSDQSIGATIQHSLLAADSISVPVEINNSNLTAEKKQVTNPETLFQLLSPDETEQMRTRWADILGKFVDEPRLAVQQADELVSEVLEKIIKKLADEHTTLENQWNLGNYVSTEDLRMALQNYRTYFQRLVT